MAFERFQIRPTKGGTTVDREFSLLSAEYGDGYSDAALIGASDGTRSWTLKFDVLDDITPTITLDDGSQQTRARYLWEFYQRRMANGNESFIFTCPFDGADYLARFVAFKLTLNKASVRLYSAELNLKQAREPGYTAGGESISAPNPLEI